MYYTKKFPAALLFFFILAGCNQKPVKEASKKNDPVQAKNKATHPKRTAPKAEVIPSSAPDATDTQEPKKTIQFTDALFTEFGRDFTKALEEQSLQQFMLTKAEIKQLYPEGTALIIMGARKKWLSLIEQNCKNTEIRFKGIKRGSNFKIGENPPAGKSKSSTHPFSGIPHINDLHIKTTVNGNPTIFVVDNLFFISKRWKILKIEMFD